MLGRSRSRKLKKLILAAVLLALYPVTLLGYVWFHCYSVDFGGGKNGQLDAYRHTLASAVLAYTLSPKAVQLVTAVMERKGSPADLMDRHNNAIGASIGTQARTFAEIEPTVLAEVKQGTVDATASMQTTWLPRERWRSSFFW